MQYHTKDEVFNCKKTGAYKKFVVLYLQKIVLFSSSGVDK